MKDLRRSISKALRGPKPSADARWVTTRSESVWSKADGRYVESNSEGFWYEGPWALAHNVAAVYTAPFFRFRNDDGSESTATWIAAENTDVVQGDGIEPGHNIRLRVAVGETAGAAGSGLGSAGWTLQASRNSGTWQNVVASTSMGVHDSANLTNGTAITTQRLSVVSGTTFSSTHSEECEDGLGASGETWSKDSGEIEFSIIFDADNSAGDTFDFRLADPGGLGGIVSIGGSPRVTLAGTAAKTASGTPNIASPTASGTAKLIKRVSGTVTMAAVAAVGAAGLLQEASGSPSLDEITASGVADITSAPLGASGAVVLDELWSSAGGR
jgi:hypothetical protein